ncbi:MAG: RsmD family RNA methyltransferase [Candidatus Nanoarchaeia archaeon]|jgi:tRNA (guanine26-N2/guanine27-N2)-dimethyltransferase
MKIITEGSTVFKAYTADIVSKQMPVFYNPDKEFDRSLSVKIVQALKPKNAIDLLAASGARGLRLMNEAGVEVTFNDLNPQAVKLIKSNLKLNKLSARVYNKNANQLLYDLNEFFDFIDLDPFGTPNPYLDACIKHTSRHGVLAVTATDTAALNGARSKAGLRKYHAVVSRCPFMKELGLRVLIKHVIEKGAEQELAMKPILSHCTKHYYRAYFQKELGAGRCDSLLSEIKNLYYNPQTGYRGLEEQKGCIALGPIYTGSINSLKVDDDFVKSLNVEDEFPPYHYNTIELGFKQEPKMDLLLKKFKAIRSHYDKKVFKTKLSLAEMKKINF